VLICAGRQANVEQLNLEAAGVALCEKTGNIKVDKHLQTSNSDIYGVGDCASVN